MEQSFGSSSFTEIKEIMEQSFGSTHFSTSWKETKIEKELVSSRLFETSIIFERSNNGSVTLSEDKQMEYSYGFSSSDELEKNCESISMME